MKKFLLSITATVISVLTANAQCNFIHVTSTATDTVSYIFSGGAFQYGCAPIAPSYWFVGNGVSVTINFVSPATNPSLRVWGMNDDDSASVSVNGVNYPLTASTASYDTKVVCGISPGPDGVLFSGGKLVGANNNNLGNYSYQNVQINTTNINSILLTGLSGNGWGFAGVTVCPSPIGIADYYATDHIIGVYPNPTNQIVNFSDQANVQLTNVSGQIVASRKSVNRLDLRELPAGIYFVLLTDNNGQVLKRGKIVKE